MRIVKPYPDIPGDNEDAYVRNGGEIRPRIMARSGQLLGFDRTHAVWTFGFTSNSEAAIAYGIHVPDDNLQHGFLFILATHAGTITDTFRGFALELPDRFKRVLDSKPLLVVGRPS